MGLARLWFHTVICALSIFGALCAGLFVPHPLTALLLAAGYSYIATYHLKEVWDA